MLEDFQAESRILRDRGEIVDFLRFLPFVLPP